MNKYPIKTAEHNRKKCYFCDETIKKGSKLLEIGVSAWNNQLSRRAVCRDCVKGILDKMTDLKEFVQDLSEEIDDENHTK
jgi:hypothetical protein